MVIIPPNNASLLGIAHSTPLSCSACRLTQIDRYLLKKGQLTNSAGETQAIQRTEPLSWELWFHIPNVPREDWVLKWSSPMSSWTSSSSSQHYVPRKLFTCIFLSHNFWTNRWRFLSLPFVAYSTDTRNAQIFVSLVELSAGLSFLITCLPAKVRWMLIQRCQAWSFSQFQILSIFLFREFPGISIHFHPFLAVLFPNFSILWNDLQGSGGNRWSDGCRDLSEAAAETARWIHLRFSYGGGPATQEEPRRNPGGTQGGTQGGPGSRVEESIETAAGRVNSGRVAGRVSKSCWTAAHLQRNPKDFCVSGVSPAEVMSGAAEKDFDLGRPQQSFGHVQTFTLFCRNWGMKQIKKTTMLGNFFALGNRCIRLDLWSLKWLEEFNCTES